MTTHLLRHARTNYSARYLVNGNPRLPLLLDNEGVRACEAARRMLPISNVQPWITSAFPRAQQTAALLQHPAGPPATVNPALNELDYGDFDGSPFLDYATWLQRHGPCARPPGSAESQREGIRRMLHGLLGVLDCPGPRVVVAHGLLLSVLEWHLTRTPGHPIPLFFPEAPYLEPLTMTDERLATRTAVLLRALGAQDREVHSPAQSEARALEQEAASPHVANVEPPSNPLEEKFPHA
ncbi:histidine phosphatase family protein [Streptomyces sp. SCUT-3]|uniref:histidine phosphatase family protein n=1 Tax=Streptomyces sp. SCUT-3 TaxID=2684469 RepID=UPI000CBE6709|nr:histidine phosphatase family protein [Streptomyces sp. SCUT-3]PLW65692.1 histidine phosphatase family protein [Streptomyces sp. DJ]QMV23494.1 histidine phosphatase family protein [Streptomyces sp. SCUT-3]